MIYLDTSVAIPLFVNEPASDAVSDWYSRCDEALVASDWLHTEFASAISLKTRRGEIGAEQADAVWLEFEDFFRNAVRRVPVSSQSFEAAARLARVAASGLRVGDSLHLAVASQVAGSMATLDANLALNAEKAGLSLVRFPYG